MTDNLPSLPPEAVQRLVAGAFSDPRARANKPLADILAFRMDLDHLAHVALTLNA